MPFILFVFSYVISFYFREIRRVDNDQEIISLFPYFQVILLFCFIVGLLFWSFIWFIVGQDAG